MIRTGDEDGIVNWLMVLMGEREERNFLRRLFISGDIHQLTSTATEKVHNTR